LTRSAGSPIQERDTIPPKEGTMARRILLVPIVLSLALGFYVLAARTILRPIVELPQLPNVTGTVLGVGTGGPVLRRAPA
jgi:hypothetical protein